MNPATTPSIRLDGVVKRFPRVVALDGISANIFPGRLTGLVGPDGAGKTTLIRLMTGLLQPDQGTISVMGRDTVRQQGEIAHLAIICRNASVFMKTCRCSKTCSFTPNCANCPRSGTGDFRPPARIHPTWPVHRPPGRQALGRNEAEARPRLRPDGPPRGLLLDEPGVGVDPVSRQDLWRMVGELTQEGMAVLWSTAYLDEAERCESILLLNEGRLEYAGEPGEPDPRRLKKAAARC